MNIVGVVGTVISKEIGTTSATLLVRVARPFISDVEYDEFLVSVNPRIFKAELSTIKPNETVSIKGRAESEGGSLRLIAERVQLV